MTTANEIADKIAADNSLTKVQAKGIVEAVFKAIAEAAGSDAETSIPGFEEADICACGGAQGCTEQMILKREGSPFGGAFDAISLGSSERADGVGGCDFR